MKKFRQFNEEEQEAIKDLNGRYFIAEMSDSYEITQSEQQRALEEFNKKFSYDFKHFAMTGWGNIEDTWFE